MNFVRSARARVLALAVVAGTMALAATPASAVVRLVDDDNVQCPTATFNTIQAAVDAANPGDQVQVCNGTYAEQVHVTDDNIDVLSKVALGATIVPPAGGFASDPKAIVWLEGGNNQIRRFRIAGPGPGQTDTLQHGVLVENNASKATAHVLDNRITDIRDNPAAANPEGIGVRIGREYAGTAGRATVQRNTILSYQKAGVVVDGPGSWGDIGGNTITGLGPLVAPFCGSNPPPAQQGVQISRGAGADVNSNTISQNAYGGNPCDSGDQTSSIGILVFDTHVAKDPRGTRISRLKTNTVFENDIGIALTGCGVCGVPTVDVNNWLIETNRVRNNGSLSRPAYDSGIYIDEVGGAGSGGGNRFNANDARTNVGFDCEDHTVGGGTGGTGNTWINNRGADDTPAVICAPVGAGQVNRL